jgi:hypothetical protein
MNDAADSRVGLQFARAAIRTLAKSRASPAWLLQLRRKIGSQMRLFAALRGRAPSRFFRRRSTFVVNSSSGTLVAFSGLLNACPIRHIPFAQVEA